MQTVTYKQSKFAVAHNGNGVVHFAELQSGQEFATGQPYVRQPATEAELEKDVDELKGVQNFYKAQKFGELYLLAEVNDRYLKPVFDHQDGHELEDAPFDIETHHLWRYDKHNANWVKI